jgi:hypothetical protein
MPGKAALFPIYVLCGNIRNTMGTMIDSGSGLIFDPVDLVSRNLESPYIEVQSADLYTLNYAGKLQAARNPTIEHLIDRLEAFNRSLYQEDGQAVRDCSGALSLM